MGMLFENPGEGRSIREKIYIDLLIVSSGFTLIQVRKWVIPAPTLIILEGVHIGFTIRISHMRTMGEEE